MDPKKMSLCCSVTHWFQFHKTREFKFSPFFRCFLKTLEGF